MRVTAARNTCTTFALCIMMWSEIAIGRNGVAARTKLLSIMGFMCVRICEVINHCPCINAGQSPFPSFPHMRVGDGGRTVSGIWLAIQQLPQRAQSCLRTAWQRAYNTNLLVYASIEEDWLLLKDITSFLAVAQRTGYAARKREPHAAAFITGLRNEILWWLADLFDIYISEATMRRPRGRRLRGRQCGW